MGILTTVILIYIGCCGYLYLAQRSFIYFPTPESRNVMAEDLRLDIDGATLQIWRLAAEKEEAVIYFGGNAEDVAQNLGQFSSIFPDKAIYLVNYRGYGASTGTPSDTAPGQQICRLWHSVGQAVCGALSDQPIWISTSGLGVAWLHIRLDSSPKYYQHQPYKIRPTAENEA